MTQRARLNKSSAPAPLTPAQVHTISLAINRWFRNKRGSDRVWHSLVQACGTPGAPLVEVSGIGPTRE
ncbi:MAG: hypothetical protein HY870_12860 [Chloroflexi bacterium]|nr:hypothetical protein [Chloroflexota bacterium]